MRFSLMVFLLTVAMMNQAYANWIQFGDQSLPCSSQYDVVQAKNLYTATVLDNGTGKLHFVKNPATDKQCASDGTKCEEDAYLIPGDRVIVSSGTAELSCVLYISAKGNSKMGLLPARCLDFETNVFAKFDTQEMQGSWKTGNSTITISGGENSSFVMIEGDAGNGPPSYHTGSIMGPAFLQPEGMLAGYQDNHYDGTEPAMGTPEPDDGCRVRLRSLTHFMVVEDNDRCGGQGVSFSGVYVKPSEAGK
ncbi:hypothetical protein HRR99_03990 [Agrobacterium vaccinii]|uniref:hypothetical protein n=1 Tax=Agrobacterium vaccinii TaxID=2735528 RepID=UPI001E48F995|nr:hypothetical protein [Agrobacterium vaccinii]UHS60741.1 hypothetical protein HRR99_03990 [Agrobacterium vaccinii]